MGSACACILKIICLVILFIVMVVGYHAHFESSWSQKWNDMPEALKEAEKNNPKFPSAAIPMEEVFLSIVTIFFILCVFMFIVACFMPMHKLKSLDVGFYVVAGVCILLAGLLMLSSACIIDKYMVDIHTGPLESVQNHWKDEEREQLKFFNKIGAGLLAMLNGILYFVTACVVKSPD